MTSCPLNHCILVSDFIRSTASRYGSKTALVFEKTKLSYAELDDASNRFANILSTTGFQRGDRAVILAENSPAVVIALFGILKAGGAFSVINPTTKAERLAYIIGHCKAKALISDSTQIEKVLQVIERTPCLQEVWLHQDVPLPPDSSTYSFRSFEDDIANVSLACPNVPCIDLDLAALIYTSGSTGHPKGVMMTHRSIVSAATSINLYLQNTPDDIILDVLPISFDYGLYQIFLAFQAGATVVLERSFNYPYSVIKRLIEEKVTAFPGVPTLFAILFRLKLENYHFPILRYITNTGATLPPSYSEKLQQMFPGVKIFSMYGLTECKRVSYLPPEQLSKRPASVGKAMPNVEVYLVDEQNRLVEPGEIGELVVRGSNVMRGYWDDPDSTAKVLKLGRYPGEQVLYTGDLFRMDAEGYLYFVSRKDDLIKSRGERISPKEIEDVLYNLEGISETKVAGIPDEILGQAIKVVIAVQEGVQLTKEDVIRHCMKYLEDFKVPHQVEFVSALPKTATGKIKLNTPI